MELCSTHFHELSKCIHETVRRTSIATFATYLTFVVEQPRDGKMAVNRTGYKLAAMLTDIIQVSPYSPTMVIMILSYGPHNLHVYTHACDL